MSYNKFKIILITLLVAILSIIGFFIFKNFYQKAEIDVPGPLSGPTRSIRAEKLDSNEIIKWTNFYRNQNGFSSLSQNSQLEEASKKRALDMFEKQYFAHTSPTGEGAADLVKAEGYQYKIIGENLALGDFKDEKELVDAWMASPGHRANILNPGYKEIGVASKLDQFNNRLTWISVQIFATKAPQCTAPSTQLKKEIEDKKSLLDTASKLYQEGAELINQGNEKIKQGNAIYQATGDRQQAQVFWTDGENLQSSGQGKIDQAKNLEKSTSDLSSLSDQYNKQVQIYNQCIKK